jgi:ElaB/YqjD/DUF883 family membrane-anchored ribosome-binding protein
MWLSTFYISYTYPKNWEVDNMAKDDVLDTRQLRDTLADLKAQVQSLERNFTDNEINLQEKIEGLKQTAVEKKQELEHKVKDHPMSSVGIAFGAGILAGLLTGTLMHKK